VALYDLQIYPHHREICAMNLKPLLRVFICQTREVQMVKHKLAHSTLISEWSNLQTGWCNPITVYWTSRTTLRLLGVWRYCIVALSEVRTICSSYRMNPSTGRGQSMINSRDLKSCCHWNSITMLSVFSGSGIKSCWRNVQLGFRWQETMDCKAPRNWWLI